MSTFEMKDFNIKSSDSSASLSMKTSHHSNDSFISSKLSPFLVAVACTSALTAFHFGYAITSINVPSKMFSETCPSLANPPPTVFGLQACFNVSKAAWGLVGMGLPIGGWIGGSLAPKIVSGFSSLRGAILFLNVPLFLAYCCMALSVNLSMLVVGRILLGFAAGASGMMVPLYLASVSPLAVRGIFTNFFQLFLCLGTFIAETVSYSADLGVQLWLWRFSFGAGVLIIAFQVILDQFGFFPESPRDLDATGKNSEAKLIRDKLGIILRDQTTPNADVKTPRNSDLPSPVDDRNEASTMKLLQFKVPMARKSVALGILLHAGQQISGVTAIFFYSSMIIKDAPTAPVFLSFINLAVTLLAIWLLERAGRRPIALFSVAGSAVALLALAASYSSFPGAAPFLLILFVACFAVGLGPIPWMIVPEIFPATWPFTPTAISICVSANWITNIVVSGSFPFLADTFREDVLFFAFGISCTALLICLSQWLPETKNRPANFI